VASTCIGAFRLGRSWRPSTADGATTHWNSAQELQARFPKVKVDADRIFIVEDQDATSAGMTAGIGSRWWAMVEEDLGAEVAGP